MMRVFASYVPLDVIGLTFPRTLSSLMSDRVWENLWSGRAHFSLPRAQPPSPPTHSLPAQLKSDKGLWPGFWVGHTRTSLFYISLEEESFCSSSVAALPE